MNIIAATIIHGHGSDKVMLHTDLDEACYPYNGRLALEFHAAQGSGIDYTIKNFNLQENQITIIERYVK